MAGALAGAWLGLQATTDLVALLAAIAGAIAGANLALIVLDISRAGSVSPVAAQPQPTGTIAEA